MNYSSQCRIGWLGMGGMDDDHTTLAMKFFQTCIPPIHPTNPSSRDLHLKKSGREVSKI